jgi:hypothetical protein
MRKPLADDRIPSFRDAVVAQAVGDALDHPGRAGRYSFATQVALRWSTCAA